MTSEGFDILSRKDSPPNSDMMIAPAIMGMAAKYAARKGTNAFFDLNRKAKDAKGMKIQANPQPVFFLKANVTNQILPITNQTNPTMSNPIPMFSAMIIPHDN
ncbi:MAG: hypothetical protein QM703_09365 [Gemmatales bacterium]